MTPLDAFLARHHQGDRRPRRDTIAAVIADVRRRCSCTACRERRALRAEEGALHRRQSLGVLDLAAEPTAVAVLRSIEGVYPRG